MKLLSKTLIAACLFPLPLLAQVGLYDDVDSYIEHCEDTCRHIHGIDISHYQGEVFWDAIGDNRRIAYVYLKATEGGDRIDQRYADNIYWAHQNGLMVGSYHFFRPRTPLQLQLKNFTTQCRPEDQDLIPLIDVETLGRLQPDAFLDSLLTFLTMVEDYYQQKPLVYSGRKFYNNYLAGFIDDYPLMIAQYTEEPPVLVDNRDYIIWQYTGHGSINGVRGEVDKSRMMGQHRLRELWYRRKEASQEKAD